MNLLEHSEINRFKADLTDNIKINEILRIAMAGAQALIRFTYFSRSNTETKLSGVITTEIPGKSESSALKYLTERYPDKRRIELTEIVWKC